MLLVFTFYAYTNLRLYIKQDRHRQALLSARAPPLDAAGSVNVLLGIGRPSGRTLGFQSMKTAYATIKGFEVMRMFKKGQFAAWIEAIGGGTEASFVNRLFGIYA